MMIILDKSLDFIPNVKMLNPGLARGLGCLSPREQTELEAGIDLVNRVLYISISGTKRFDNLP
jgi:hypothetical protein